MKRKFLLLLTAMLLCAACPRTSGAADLPTHVITDMAGRRVAVPVHIHKVLSMSPVGAVFMYTLAPDLLAGWNYQPDPGELAYMPERYRKLPVLGGWFGKNNTGNIEEIIKAHPDVLISMGDVLGVPMAERVQSQTHIPVVVLDGALKNLPKAYEQAGEIFGLQIRAKLLASECGKAISDVESKVSRIPQEKRKRYYYAEGPTGLETEPGGGMHSEAMDFAGGINVASVPNQKGYGHTPVSIEQVLSWNPDIIITGYDHTQSPGNFYRAVYGSAAWKYVRAVRSNEVYEAPQYPYSWIDRPPSVNRIIGIKWMANLLYPEVFHYDMRAETRSFYRTFYRSELTDAELNQLLSNATRKR